VKVAGDLNGDGVADMIDAMMLFRYVSGQADLSDEEAENADVVADGVLDIKDALKLYQFASGAIGTL